MGISTKLIRMQIEFFKNFVNGCTIETARMAQARMGELMTATHKSKVWCSTQIFREFIGAWIAPKQQKSDGVILYLHGGGYVAGDLDYAMGFGTVLAAKNGVKVFCAAYRLAPEHPYPAALDDALEAYRFLISSGYFPNQIILCGESAGGGLIYALALKLKELSMPMPGGFIAISPWTDLTLSGSSYVTNAERDPSMKRERLQFYAEQYAKDFSDPYVSPLLGDFDGFPQSLIFVGGDEILLDDSVMLHRKLQSGGCRSSLVIKPGMWHVYILYGVNEAKMDHQKISEFIKVVLNETN